MPLRSAGWKRSSQGTGTKTQFSGLGKTPTGELKELRMYVNISVRRKEHVNRVRT
jgi:hypothetical protein